MLNLISFQTWLETNSNDDETTKIAKFQKEIKNNPNKNVFDCLDCGVNTKDIHEYYMLRNEVWKQIGNLNNMLCIGCAENRLGRKLNKNDFVNAPINKISANALMLLPKSKRLIDRLSH